jgi:pimeloyl-ACP methyl ester carboxylesterase
VNAFTNSDGLRIAYRRSGTGPTLVLLHGFIADGRVWRTQIDDFSRDFDVIAWDAPGCGQSSDTPEDFSMRTTPAASSTCSTTSALSLLTSSACPGAARSRWSFIACSPSTCAR